MKLPRTLRILHLMTSVTFSVLHNEPLLLRGNLAKLDELGGIYIKFLQIIVLNLNSQNQELFLELLAVYEDSKPDILDVEQHLLRKNAMLLQNIAHIDKQPFATGSFGQVYRAQLHSGESVAIKVLRPGVMRYLRFDLRLLGLLSWAYTLIDRQKMLNFRDIYKNFRKTCLQETDYQREAAAGQYFYDQYLDHPRMVIPKTYTQFCTSTILVQELIIGTSVTQALRQQAKGVDVRAELYKQTGSDLHVQLYQIGYELLTRAVAGKLMQADPHPGNIILLPDNKVALIDFGMTYQLLENRTAFYELLVQYRAYYQNELAIESFALAALKFLSPTLHAAVANADTVFGKHLTEDSLMTKLRSATRKVAFEEGSRTTIDTLLRQKMIMKVLFFAINRDNRFGFTFDLRALNLLKSAHSYLSLAGQFDQSGTIIREVVTDVVSNSTVHQAAAVDEYPLKLDPYETMEVLSQWFDKMARNDPYIMQEVAGDFV